MTDNTYGQNTPGAGIGAGAGAGAGVGAGAGANAQSAYQAAYGVPAPSAPVTPAPAAASAGTPAGTPAGAPAAAPVGAPVAAPSAAGVPGQASAPASSAATPAATPTSAPASAAAFAPKAVAPAKSSAGKTFLLAFAGALVACGLFFGVATAVGAFSSISNVTLGASTVESVKAADAEASLAEAVANKCLPSVASITVFAAGQTSTGNPLYDYFNGGGSSNDGAETEAGLGSGVVLSEDGYVITNNHVVASGTRFQATIEGETYDADLVGTDASSDVAILKVKNASGLTPIAVANSDDIKIGQWVMSIGSPFGLEQSVATGIISATSRSQIMDTSQYGTGTGEVVIYPNLIQTDAAINPGNSGGALVNANGQLVGINTLITSYSGNYSGVGFAIPSNYAMGLAKDIISGKEPTHAQLGVNLSNVNASIAERYGFAADAGAYVSGVVEGSSAEAAGIQKGDIIVAFDGKEVSSASDLMMDVRTKAPGDTVSITVNRDGETKTFEVKLGSDAASQKAKAQQQELQQRQQQQQDSSGGSNGLGGSDGSDGSQFINPFDLFGMQ